MLSIIFYDYILFTTGLSPIGYAFYAIFFLFRALHSHTGLAQATSSPSSSFRPLKKTIFFKVH
jgi:sterol desaturase/sphingolipid hydroxylase (fatty acid hydroxylase superfamily)